MTLPEGYSMAVPDALPKSVAAAFARLPEADAMRLLKIRRLIFATAKSTAGVGEIVETLKWGQPSYLTARPKSGTIIRLGLVKDQRPAMFCHCQTSLIAEFRDMYPAEFDFDGNRALVLKPGDGIPATPLQHCIARALTYHLAKA